MTVSQLRYTGPDEAAGEGAMKSARFVNKLFRSSDLGSMVGDRRMIGLYYECTHCRKGWAFALPGSMYRGGASLQTVGILQHVEPLTDDSGDLLVDHLSSAHSLRPARVWFEYALNGVAFLFPIGLVVGLLVGLVLGLIVALRNPSTRWMTVSIAIVVLLLWRVVRNDAAKRRSLRRRSGS